MGRGGKWRAPDIREALPKIASIHAQWVRCGRAGCRCARGDPHGPYHYIFFRERGKLRKRYVPKHEVDAMRAEIERARTAAQAGCRVREAGWERWRDLTRAIREAEEYGRTDG